MHSQNLSLIHNLRIPGWAQTEILNVLGIYASQVPENGTILELGGLFGRSTYTLGKNKKDSVELTTIDIWPTLSLYNIGPIEYWSGGVAEMESLMKRVHGEKRILNGSDFFEMWGEYTNDVVNHKGIIARTNIDNSPFPMFDLIYHDASHEYNEVYEDLNHWFPKLKDTGNLILDDYEPGWPGVMQAVDQFVAENNLETEMVTYRNIKLRRKT